MKSKRMLASVMAMVMTVSTFVPTYAAAQSGAAQVNAALESKISQILSESASVAKISADQRLAGKKKSDSIRIIVELEKDAVIDHAIAQGLRVSDMSENAVSFIEDDLNKTMDLVQDQMKAKSISADIHYEFTNVINGFSATTSIEDAEKIEALPNVKRVLIVNEYTRPEPVDPHMVSSNDIIHSQQTWDLNFKGTGMVVAVIDSSFEPTHPSMQTITVPEKAKIKNEAALPSDVPGEFFNIKMPYGYNYWDNTTHLASSSDHGTHVAGTVAANGDPANGGIKGVAPEAQVLGMKVFGDDPSISTTYDDIYIRAIEDAVKLGADAINMSLGSTASFLIDESQSPARVAIKKAADSGLIVAVSAGNSDRFGSGHADPKAANPDAGVVGAPSLNPDTFSVASLENTHVMVPALVATAGKFGYKVSGSFDPAEVLKDQNLEYVDCGIGAMPKDISADSTQNDFDGKNLSGKVALIQRGSFGFGVKVLNAQKAGAIGVIIYNSAAGGDALLSMSFGTQEAEITIPAVAVGLSNGKLLKEAADKAVKFTSEMAASPNPNTGKMSDFTSYGTTPSLDFKPEITAPGGNIYSTIQGGKYDLMSGTSMAAPHVAGGSALILQRVDQDFKVVGQERSLLAKNLIMSTAAPLKDKTSSAYTSPRRGGAGVMDLLAASTSNVIVVDSNTGVSKVNLKEVGSEFSYDVTVKNMGKAPVHFNIDGTVQSEYVEEGRITNYPGYLQDATIKFTQGDKQIYDIEVPHSSSVTFTVTINVENAKMDGVPFLSLYPNGGFVEGFIRLADRNEEVPTVGLPYVGFYGDWNDAPVLDVSVYDATPQNAQFYGGGYNGLYTEAGAESTPFLGSVGGKNTKDRIAISPDGDGYYDYAAAYFTFLRNAKSYEVNILSKDRELLRTIEMGEYVRKNFYDGDSKNPKAKDFGLWNGKINDKVVEGEYIYQIKTMIDYADKGYQLTEYPIRVDLTAPVIKNLKFDKLTQTVTGDVSDNMMLNSVNLFVGDTRVDKIVGTGLSTFSFKIAGEIPNNTQISVLAVDDASNVAQAEFVYTAFVNDFKAPVITMTTPETLEINGSSEVSFSGTVVDPTGLQSFTINGEPVVTQYDSVKDVYSYNHVATFEDGPHSVKVIAIDRAGNKYEFEKKFYVDSKAPIIDLKTAVVPNVSNDTASIKLEGTVTDNYSGFKFYINGSMKANIEGAMDAATVKAVTKAFAETIKLNTGNNVITIKAVDYIGHTTTQVLNIYRMKPGETGPTITAVISPAKNVSAENPVKIDLSADKETVWNVKVNDPSNKTVSTFTGTGLKLSNTWAPEAGIKVNGTYKVLVEYTQMGTTKKAEYSFEVYNYPLMIKNVSVVKKQGTVSVNAELENLSANGQNPMLVVQVTDDQGKVINLSTATLKGLQSKQVVELSSGFATPATGRYNVEVFVWTGWDNAQVLGAKKDTSFMID